MRIAKTAIVLVVLIWVAPAVADQAPPDSEGGRYTFNKVEDGFVRLDTQTGQVALCDPRTVGWACQAAPDDRTALESEIDRLRGENALLKKELLSHGLPLPGGLMPGSATSDDEVSLRLPTRGEVDRAIAYVNRAWHRLVETVTHAEQQVFNKS